MKCALTTTASEWIPTMSDTDLSTATAYVLSRCFLCSERSAHRSAHRSAAEAA